MKNIIILLFLIASVKAQQTPAIQSQILDLNNISIGVNSDGSAIINNYYLAGLWKNQPVIYEHGPWLAGKINDTLKTAFIQWASHFTPGLLNKTAFADSAEYHVFKIGRADDITNPDYYNWPFELGAPGDKSGNPLVYGDLMTWNVFNGAYANPGYNNYWDQFISNMGMPVEIRQIVFQRNTSEFENTVFYQWELLNRSSYTIDSMYFSFWSDLDFGETFQNFPAVDSSLGLAYCWSPIDSVYYYYPDKRKIDISPGYVLLQGPEENDSILPVTAFHPIGDDSWGGWERIAWDPLEIFKLSKGLKPDGSPVINPFTNKATAFPYNGNPVDSTGWLFDYNRTGGGAGVLFSSGPFSMEADETQMIRMAFIVGHGDDHLDAVRDLKSKAAFLKATPFDQIAMIEKNPVIPENFINVLPNFPNPFNSATTIRIDLKTASDIQITLFDNLGRFLKTVHSGFHLKGESFIAVDMSSFASGVYFYRIESRDKVFTRKMLLLR
ncbi:MAG: T9SS type A sorting domain-containing protein [Calditrichaeota bacterium]|nr:T9SS type A sorting domain-containing protein [Calditrichota bacterium]